MNLNVSEGTEVIAIGNISYYKPSGKITFVVNNLQIDGVGALAIEYDNRLREVQEKGWCDEVNKKQIPKIPNNIGIVTAATGDAVRDLISNMRRRYKVANIYLFPTLVQGDGAAKDIASKIIMANNFSHKLDVLIVGRGGGSYEDLWAFNEWPVLNAIHESKIPIITGIGHEPDVTIADYLADKRASTPTAAGEYATPDINAIYKSLDNTQTQLANILQNKLTLLRTEIINLKNNLQAQLENKLIALKIISKTYFVIKSNCSSKTW
ncbi:exodeoxyribonuclease VII large subunit [Spiroplasma clarkii]|uniref:exodeoxyribonuclease VII large subunit n=1 Tax=Spiroplasma clarkii TaxID=2139 RepID=UPI001649F11C|nr:exodeoxyribonuclease VII large subunit [Spiroplasma clarkii]